MRSARPLLQLLARPSPRFRLASPVHASPFAPVRAAVFSQLLPTARYNSTSPAGALPSVPATSRAPVDGGKQPTYELSFTCKPCSERSSHIISKQGYHSGTVLVQCPKCKGRHIISDHLKVCSDLSTVVITDG